LSLKGKPSLDRGSHEGTIRQDQWLFRRGRNDSRHRLRIILMRPNLVTNRNKMGSLVVLLLAQRARVRLSSWLVFLVCLVLLDEFPVRPTR